jgi:hypothetical protein
MRDDRHRLAARAVPTARAPPARCVALATLARIDEGLLRRGLRDANALHSPRSPRCEMVSAVGNCLPMPFANDQVAQGAACLGPHVMSQRDRQSGAARPAHRRILAAIIIGPSGLWRLAFV